jgi:hypothetical protein
VVISRTAVPAIRRWRERIQELRILLVASLS